MAADDNAQGWLRRLLRYLLPHRARLTTAFLAAFVSMGATAAIPLLIRSTVDRAVINRIDPLPMWLLLLLGAGGLRAASAAIRRYHATVTGYSVERDMRNQVFDHLQRLDFARHDELETGQLVSRTNGDLSLLYELLIWAPLMSSNIVLFAVSAVIMFTLSPMLSLAMILALPALLIGAVHMSRVLYPSSWDSLQWAGEVAGVVEESVSGVRVVKGFGQERRQLDRFVTACTRMFGARMRNARLTARYAPALELIPALGQLSILAGGGWLVIRGQLTIGTFLAFQAYLAQMEWPVRMLGQLVVQAQQAKAAAGRVFEILDAKPVVTELDGARSPATVAGALSFEDVSFAYGKGEPVLGHLDLEIAPGERVAFVGGSGSGKSTLALLVPRFYDVTGGAVRLDGVDVRDLTLDGLRGRVGMVFEDSFLFSDTVRSNIAYGRPDATDDEIEAAARAAEAHDFIEQLGAGYDTVVGERGMTLSGGQRQRVALARSLLADPQVLILDDATSSIDTRVEEVIHRALSVLMQGRTTILVAHRRSTLDLADRIVVLDGGRVVDTGTHDELMSRCPRYRDLVAGPDDDAIETTLRASGATKRLAVEAHIPTAITPGAWPPPDEVLDGVVVARSMSGNDELDAVLVEGLRSLPPIIDAPDIDLVHEAEDQRPFTLRRFLRPYRRPLAIGLALVLLQSALFLAGPWLIRRGVDDGITRRSTSGLLSVTALYFCTSLGVWAVMRSLIIQTTRTSQRLLLALRIRVFAQLQRLGLDFYEREMAGRIMTRATSDVDAVQNLLQQGLINAMSSGMMFVGSAVLLAIMNWRLAAASLSVVIPLLAVSRWFQRTSDKSFLDARDKVATVNARFQESLSGVRVAQAHVRELRNMDDFRVVTDELFKARARTAWLGSVYFPSIEFLQTAATAIVLGYGAGMVAGGSLTTGALVAFVLYLGQVFWPIQNLSQVFETYQQARAALRKINDVLISPISVPVPVPAIDPGRVSGALAFNDVHFAYTADSPEALVGVDLRIVPGETVALVGETGAGKSTIVKLVARFYDPVAGTVRADGYSLADLDPFTYRENLGYVPQESFLFTGDIRDNIAYARPDASNAEVEAAARAVGAHEFIAHLPRGYRTVVTEGGRSMSAGQRQLIALARALLVDPSILLLDEATANLDLATEARVARAMGLVSHGRTTLLIAHRLQTAQRADRIIVIDHGGIAEQGTHDELLAHEGRYASLWNAWASGLEEGLAAEPA